MKDGTVRILLFLICLITGCNNLFAQSPRTPNHQVSLSELLDTSGATFANQRLSCVLDLKFYNDEFLIDPMASHPDNQRVDPTWLRAFVSNDRTKIEGYSFPLVFVKSESSFSFSGEPKLMYFADRSSRAEGWREALNSRFARPIVVPDRQRHVIISDQNNLTQSWSSDDRNYPKAVIFPAGNLLDPRLPVEHLLVGLMTRPQRLASVVSKLIEGREFRAKDSLSSVRQIIFEEVVPKNAVIKQPVLVFLDPQRRHAITRVIIPEPGGYRQYDVMFEEGPDQSSLPTRCSVYVGATNGDVQGYAEITRLSAKRLETVNEKEFDVKFPAGTYFVDFTAASKEKAPEMAFVNDNGGTTMIHRKHLWDPEITYEKLLAADHSPISANKSIDFRQHRSQRQWFVTLLRWPWNLMTVVGLVVAGGIIRQGIKAVAKSSRRSNSKGDVI